MDLFNQNEIKSEWVHPTEFPSMKGKKVVGREGNIVNGSGQGGGGKGRGKNEKTVYVREGKGRE